MLNWTIDVSSITWGEWTLDPTAGENLSPDDGQILVQVSVIAPEEEKTEFEGFVRVENLNDPEDFELIPVLLETPQSHMTYSPVSKQAFIQVLLTRGILMQ